MKNYIKILVTLLVLSIIASFVTVAAVGDTPVFTVGNGGQFDAKIDNNGEITVPVTVNKWPGDKVAAVQVDIFFDNTALEFVTLEAQMKIDLGVMLMPVAPTWIYNVDAANANGKMTASFLDTSLGSQSFSSNSITDETAGTNVLFNMKFKVLGEEVPTDISVGDILVGEYSTGDEVQYVASEGTLAVEDCVILPYVASTDATLADILVNNITLEDFAVDTYEYIIEVANDEDVVLEAIATDDNAIVSIDGPEELIVGENIYTVTVIAEDGETTLDYVITVVRAPSTDTTLADLTIDGITIDGFEPEKEYYELVVSNDTTQLQVGVVPNHENATYVIEGNTDFIVGENEILVTVTAEDEETVYYYSIMVTREPSSDATLFDLTVDGETIADFATDAYDYVVEVENDVTEVTIDAVANHENATAVVAGGTDLAVGENLVTVTVTAEDGITELVYTITVVRAPSEDATLSDLTVDGETIADFATDAYDYVVEVENDVTEVTIDAVANHENATAVVAGGTDLAVGENVVTVTVTAEDGITELVYTITVVRAPSEDATLSDLTVDGETIADFAADVYDYTYEVENEIAVVDINVTVNHENATFEISGDENILPGKNLFTIIVTAEDETTTETYTVLVIRKLIYTVIENTENYGSSDVIITKVEGADGLRTMNVEDAEVVLTENDETPVFFVISTTPVTDNDVDFIDETPVVSIIGNVDNNDTLNIFDATAALNSIAAGTDSLPYAQQFIMDADTNGVINIFDATTILKIVSGQKPPVFN